MKEKEKLFRSVENQLMNEEEMMGLEKHDGQQY